MYIILDNLKNSCLLSSSSRENTRLMARTPLFHGKVLY